jgi:hypothetical protein
MSKRYICDVCRGSGRQSLTDYDSTFIPNLEVDCAYCVAKGLPPFIDIQAPLDGAIVEVPFRPIIDEPAPAVPNTEQKEDNDQLITTLATVQ